MRVLTAVVEMTFHTNKEGTPDELLESYVDDVGSLVFDLLGPELFDPENEDGWTLEGIQYRDAKDAAYG